jgi:DNA polymerase III alpha subunit
MAIAGFSDKTGSVDIVLFTEPYAKFAELLVNDAIVALVGRVDHSRGEPNVIIDEVIPIDQIDNHLAGRMDLEIIDEPGRAPIREVMLRVDETLREAKTTGERSVDVLLHVLDGDKTITLRPNRLKVVPDSDLVDRLKQMLGPQHVRLVDAASSPR